MLALISPSNNYLGYMHTLKVRFELIRPRDPGKCKKDLWILTWAIFNKINCNWAYNVVDCSFKGINPSVLFCFFLALCSRGEIYACKVWLLQSPPVTESWELSRDSKYRNSIPFYTRFQRILIGQGFCPQTPLVAFLEVCIWPLLETQH